MSDTARSDFEFGDSLPLPRAGFHRRLSRLLFLSSDPNMYHRQRIALECTAGNAPMIARIQSYTTEGLLPAQRIAYWNDCIRHHVTPIETRPAEVASFGARLVTANCGFVTIADVSSAPMSATHTRQRANQCTDRAFLLHLQTGDESVNCQDGREVLLRKGDFTLVDSARRFDVAFQQFHRILVVRIPEREMTRRLPQVENLTCIRMHHDRGINSIITNLIVRYWGLCRLELDARMQERISSNLLDLLATAYSQQHDASIAESSLATSRRLLIKDFIEQHLSDLRLSPSFIAGRFGYTKSHIHQLFQAEHESISHYILRRRLQEAAKALGDDAFRTRTISEIAFHWGFNSLTHFGRTFKLRFGITPTEFRQACLNGAARPRREFPHGPYSAG
jgi:AraC-like DNA-binding protein